MFQAYKERSNHMKKRIFRRYFAALLSFCLMVGMFTGITYTQAEEVPGDDFQSDLYNYTYQDGRADITIPEENLQKFVAEGYLAKWENVKLSWLDIHIDVLSEDTVIPKEILNWSAPQTGCAYIYDRIDGQDCEWQFGTSGGVLQKDFIPQVSFYIATGAAFSERTTTLGVHTNNIQEICGSQNVKFSVNKFRLNGKLMDVSDYFKTFYETYNTEEIKTENGDECSYSYFNNNSPTGNIGWFYASVERDGAWKSVTRDSCWTWQKNAQEVKGHVEFNSMSRITSPDFVISDQPAPQTDLKRLNSFSIIPGASNQGDYNGDSGAIRNPDEKDDSGVYKYAVNASRASITIPENNLQKFVDQGFMDKWKSADVNEIELNITIQSEDIKIPKELLNWAEKFNGYTTISMRDHGQYYEWRFGKSSSEFQEDFDPYVSFYKPAGTEFDQGTSCLGVKTNYSATRCAVTAKFSVNSFLLNGEQIDTADYFKNFYNTYNTDEIKSADGYGCSYSYFNNDQPEGDIGWFYLSSEDNGVLKSVIRDSCWTWNRMNENTLGHVEFNAMSKVTSSDFIISDQPVSGTEPSKVNSFSIIYGKSSFVSDRSYMYWEGFGDEIETNFNDNGTLQLNIKDMDDMLDSGKLQNLVDQNDNMFIEVFIYDQNRVIPKEFFNIIREKGIGVYVFVNLKTEIYEWGLSTNPYFEVKRDFSPYVTYERTRTTEAYFPEGTTALTFKTDCSNDLFSGGLVRKLSLNTLVVDGKSQQTSEIFQNFFDQYSIPEILQVNMYSYIGLDLPRTFNKGYIYLSNYDDERGGLTGAAKDDCWQYYKDFFNDGTNVKRAHVEMNDMVMSKSGTFIISDQPPIGSDPEKLHEIYSGNTENFTDYGAEDLKEHFDGAEEIDAKSAASADFVKAADEIGADLSVEKDGVEFTLEHENINKDIAFEPNIEEKQENPEIEKLLEQKELETKEHNIISFENSFSQEQGQLPGEVNVAYPVDPDMAKPGDDISVYYYNAGDGKLEPIAAGIVTKEGKAEFSLQHFSQYVIVKAKGAPVTTKTPDAADTNAAEATIQPLQPSTVEHYLKPTPTASAVPLQSDNGAGGNAASLTDSNKGKIYSDAGKTADYKITGDNTVTYRKHKKGAKVAIPDTITLNGHKYKVTAVADKAFFNNKKLKQLVIGRNIAGIGKNAFSGCKNLKKITIKTKKLKLKKIGEKAFAGVKPKTIRVPGGMKAKYRKWFQKRGMKWNK